MNDSRKIQKELAAQRPLGRETSAAQALKIAMGGSLASDALKAASNIGIPNYDHLKIAGLGSAATEALKVAGIGTLASDALKAASNIGIPNYDHLKIAGLGSAATEALKVAGIGTLASDALKAASNIGIPNYDHLKIAGVGNAATEALKVAGIGTLASDALKAASNIGIPNHDHLKIGSPSNVSAGPAEGPIVTPPASPREVARHSTLVNSPVALGQVVRQAREALGLTQMAFADAAGVGRRFISELENGKVTLELGKVMAVCIAAGIDLLAARR